jgi:hypothetical protein
MIEPDKWMVITYPDKHREARALYAFRRGGNGRLLPEVCGVWLKPDHVRVDLFKWIDTRKAWTDADLYAWYVITWSVADMRRAMMRKGGPKEIAGYAQHLATIALGYMDSIARGGRVLSDMPAFDIRDNNVTWRVDELLSYIRNW